MHGLKHKMKELGWRRIAFSLSVLAYLGFLGFIIVMMFLPGNWMSDMGHFDFVYTGDTHNIIHELAFALIIGTAAVGLLSQLWKPEKFAGQLVALSAWILMIAFAAITGNFVPQPLYIIFGGMTLLATALHPAGLGLFRWVKTVQINRTLFVLAIIAAVPLTVFAVTNLNVQIAGIGDGKATGLSGFFGHIIPSHGGDAAEGDQSQSDIATAIERVKQKYGNYTVAQAEREGYVLDQFCLDATSFGQPAERGAMGYHATNEDLLVGPIAAERPQALMFDADGRVLGVEYEIMADMVSEPPQLFGQTFNKLPPHPGVAHEHYALHVWFVDNPSGRFADFNPEVSCPSGSAPSAETEEMSMKMDGEVHNQAEHIALGHYKNMGVLGFIIIVVGLLASLQPPGSRLAAWIAGLLATAVGFASALLPTAESSVGVVWGLAAMVWGVAFIAAGEITRKRPTNEG